MGVLRFDYELFYYDFSIALKDGADEAIKHFMQDAKSHLKSNDVELKETLLDYATGKIYSSCVFYAHSILESYGRGKLMDSKNEYLKEYMNSELWNPVRKSKTIVGRKEGKYTNFFGEESYSKGRLEGKPIGYGHSSPNISPSYAIQNAEKKLEAGLKENGYVMRILQKHAESFFASIDYSKYFTFG